MEFCTMKFCRCVHGSIVLFVLCMKGIILLYAANIVLLLTTDPFCSDEEALKAIDELCLEAMRGRAFGNLCAPLCESLDIRYQSCTNKGGEKDVYFVSWRNFSSSSAIPLVMKRAIFSEQLMSEFYSSETKHDLEQRFLLEINHLFNQHTTEKRFENIHEVLRLFWTAAKDSTGSSKLHLLRNLHGLAIHNEYLFSLLHPNNDAIPQLYGSCGLFYFMQRVSLTLNDVDVTWISRISVARKLLDLVYRLDNSFEERLHLCDVKLDNFGIENQYNEIKILDTDSVVINSIFERKMAARHCVDDSECSIGNCLGVCDINAGQCLPVRVNSNLQGLCQEIFADSDANEHYGLLSNPPTSLKGEIERLLDECITTNSSSKNSQKTVSMKIMTQFMKILSETRIDQ